MRIINVIDKVSDLPMVPIILTEKSKRKSVRVIGVLMYSIWFFPALLVWLFIYALLAIPAMIQDA